MENKVEIPCENCITLSMCRNRVNKTHFPIWTLKNQCELLNKYCKDYGLINTNEYDPNLKKILYKGHPIYGNDKRIFLGDGEN